MEYLGINYLILLLNEDKDQLKKRPLNDYGLVKDLETFNPIKIAFHEYWNILKDMLKTDNLLIKRVSKFF